MSEIREQDHGKRRGYDLGCREDCCTKSNAVRVANLKAKRLARVEAGEITRPHERVGDKTGDALLAMLQGCYANYNCRESACLEAHREHMARYRRSQKGAA